MGFNISQTVVTQYDFCVCNAIWKQGFGAKESPMGLDCSHENFLYSH